VVPTKNRSPDLIPLAAEYEQFKKNLRTLVSSVKHYAECTERMVASRDELVEQLGLMSENSPFYNDLGYELDAEATEALEVSSRQTDNNGSKNIQDVVREWKQRNRVEVSSLQVLQQCASAQAVVNAREYRSHVLRYAIEWEQVVTERVEAELKNVKKLQCDRSHYERKVESMRRRANDLEAKGKTSPASQAEKLERNETKLKEANKTHETEAGRLCVLIEAVTKEGWKDLYLLAKNYIKWESNRVGRESDSFSQLPATLDSMKSYRELLRQESRQEPRKVVRITTTRGQNELYKTRSSVSCW